MIVVSGAEVDKELEGELPTSSCTDRIKCSIVGKEKLLKLSEPHKELIYLRKYINWKNPSVTNHVIDIGSK